MASRQLVWFRGKDLRLADHRPLSSALASGEALLLFVLDPFFFSKPKAAELAHRLQFLLESLAELQTEIAARGGELMVVAGRSVDVVPELARLWRVDRVVAQRWSEPFARKRDAVVASKLNVPFELFDGETLLPPQTVRNGQGAPYSVFTPFSRAAREHAGGVGAALPAPSRFTLPPERTSTPTVPIPTLQDLGITPNPNLPPGGERAAQERLARFVASSLSNYKTERDILAHEGTSGLSADLKFGTLSPRQAWNAVRTATAKQRGESATVFESQLLWREFAHDILWNRPSVLKAPFRSDFEGFPWDGGDAEFELWATGKTGYPVVDAAARQLLERGFVHNRARMIAASFLTKHLLVDVKKGEAHNMKYLVDGDWANNNMGWQWSAGCGCDAQPYFRVFNPTLQGERFDPDGDYVRRFVPELRDVPAKYIHKPWEAPIGVLKAARVVLGKSYPAPCVDHAEARDRFLKIAEEHLRSAACVRKDKGSTSASSG